MQVSKRERKGAQKLTSRRFHHNKESGSMSFGVRETRFCSRFFCRPTQCKSRQCHAFVCGGDRVKRQKIWKMGSNPCSGGHRLDHVWLPSTCHGYGPAAFDIASHFGHEASVTDGSRPRTMKRKCQHLSTWEACAS